jgi:ribosome biogenesis GTPase A
MKTLLSSTDLVIECRDYRVPLTSRNPLFEETLSGRVRLVVYTKKDLGSNGRKEDIQVIHTYLWVLCLTGFADTF